MKEFQAFRSFLIKTTAAFFYLRHQLKLAIKKIIFPVIPKNVENFVIYLFLHSLFLTASTPLARAFRGRWMGVGSVMTLVNKVPITGTLNATIYGDAQFLYRTEEESPGIDTNFGLHAAFGLFWLLVAFVQMVPLRRLSLAMHRNFGLVAILVFCGHMLASLNILIFDEAKHHWINRAELGGLTFISTAYMLLSMKAIWEGRISEHQDYAIRCFLYSIEGAGTIRQVAHMQLFASPYVPSLFSGPGECQSIYSGEATHCVEQYFVRRFFSRLLTFYYICVYTTYKKESNYSQVFIKEKMMEAICTLAFFLVDQSVSGLHPFFYKKHFVMSEPQGFLFKNEPSCLPSFHSRDIMEA